MADISATLIDLQERRTVIEKDLIRWKEVVDRLDNWQPLNDVQVASKSMAIFYAQGKIGEARRERESLRIVILALVALCESQKNG